jgi:hypothetical protein
MVDENHIPTADGRQDIVKLASLPGDAAVVARTRPESHALVVTFSRDGEEPEEMFASDGQRAWRDAITLIAKREWLLCGDTLTIRRMDEDHIVEVIQRVHGESLRDHGGARASQRIDMRSMHRTPRI